MQSSHTLASSGTCTHTDTYGQLKNEHKNTFKIKNKVKSDRSRPDLNFCPPRHWAYVSEHCAQQYPKDERVVIILKTCAKFLMRDDHLHVWFCRRTQEQGLLFFLAEKILTLSQWRTFSEFWLEME